MSRGTQEPVQRASKTFVYGAVTRSGRSFQIVRLADWFLTRRPCGLAGPTTPPCKHDGLGSSAFARRYWRNHYCFLFLQVLRWFTSLRCLPPTYGFSRGYLGINQGGFPHSDIPGSKLVCSSPRLIAACHVLHRLLAPRHSPYALSSLTIRKGTYVQSGPGAPGLGTRRAPRPSPARPDRRQFPLAHCVCCGRKPPFAGYSVEKERRARRPTPSARQLVENTGLEPVTSWLQTRRSPS